MIEIINSKQYYILESGIMSDEGVVATVIPAMPFSSTSTFNVSSLKQSRGKRLMNNVDHVHVDGVLYNARFVINGTICRGLPSYSCSTRDYKTDGMFVYRKVRSNIDCRPGISRTVRVEWHQPQWWANDYSNGKTLYRYVVFLMYDDEEGVVYMSEHDAQGVVTATSKRTYTPVQTSASDVDFHHVYDNAGYVMRHHVWEMALYVEGSSDVSARCMNECCTTIFPMQASVLCTIADVISAFLSFGSEIKGVIPAIKKLKNGLTPKQFTIVEHMVQSGSFNVFNKAASEFSSLVNAFIKSGDSKAVAKQAATLWLSYRYVIMTTLMDAEAYKKHLCDALIDLGSWNDQTFFRTRASKHEGEWLFTLNCLFHPNFGDVPLSEAWTKARGVGLQVNTTLIWDVLPFSFIVDWFLPISSICDGIDLGITMSRFDFDACTMSRKREVVFQTEWGPLTCVSYQRHLIDPPGMFYGEVSDPSTKTKMFRSLDAISLITGFV